MSQSKKRVSRFLDGEFIVPVIMMCFAVSYVVQVTNLPTNVLIFPVMVLIPLIAINTWHLILFLKKKIIIEREGEKVESRGKIMPLFITLSLLVLLTLNFLGAVIALVIYVFLSMLLLGERRVFIIVLASVVFVGAVTYLFQYILYVPLPRGIFGLLVDMF